MFVIAFLLGFLTTLTTGFLIWMTGCIVARRLRVARNMRAPDWRLPKGSHHNLRRSFVKKILDMLRAKTPGPDPERRLPRIAKSLEYRLYYKAVSLGEYQDETTLKARLRDIVREACEAAGDHAPPPTDEETGTVPMENGARDSTHDEQMDPEHQPLVSTQAFPAVAQETRPVVLEIETAVQLDLEDQKTTIVAE